MSQLSLTDALAAADAAIARVGEHAPPDWHATALAAVFEVASRCPTFTVDAVQERLADVPPPPEPRAMGAVIREAVAAGWIAKTSEYRPTANVRAHACPRVVWRSLLFKEAA